VPTRRHLILTLLTAALLAAGVGASAQIDRAKLARLHAAFVLNFMKFTQWPEPPDRPLRVLVIGSPAVGAALKQAVDGRTVYDQPVRVDTRSTLPADDALDDDWDRYARDVAGYDAVYVPAARPPALAQLTRAVALKPVLLIADTPAGIDVGCHLAFGLEDDRVVFHANLTALEASPLGLRAGLLRLARIHR